MPTEDVAWGTVVYRNALKMGIGTFTTLLLGYKTAERLYELERIEGREEAVERLDDVLFHKIPYISDYI